MDDIIGSRQIETCAAGFEADQEQIALARLKGGHALRPRLRRHAAVEILIANAARIERFTHLFEMTEKLAEYERLVAVAQEFVGEVQKRGEFGAFERCPGVDQRRMAAQAAKLTDFRQDMDLRWPAGPSSAAILSIACRRVAS